MTKTEKALWPGTVITLGLALYGVALLSLVAEAEATGCLAVLRWGERGAKGEVDGIAEALS